MSNHTQTDAFISPTKEELIWHGVYSRYFTLVGLTILAYDCCLTSKDEWQSIWSKRWTISKVLYIINRYGMMGVLLYYLAVLGAFLNFNTKSCQRSAVTLSVLTLTIDTAGSAIVLNRLVYLWGSSGRMMWLMAIGFVVIHAAMLGFSISATKTLSVVVRYIHILQNDEHACFPSAKTSQFTGTYAAYVVMDVYAFVLLLVNALSRPRCENEKLLQLLYKDGLIFFLICFSMHLFSLLNASVSPPSMLLISVTFGGAMVANAVARLYLNLSKEIPSINHGYTPKETQLNILDDETMYSPPNNARQPFLV